MSPTASGRESRLDPQIFYSEPVNVLKKNDSKAMLKIDQDPRSSERVIFYKFSTHEFQF